MKYTLFSVILLLGYVGVDAQTAEQQAFCQAKTRIEAMLNCKEPLSYERAIFTIENAWYNNKIGFTDFDSAINFHLQNVQEIISTNYDPEAITEKPGLLHSKEEIEKQYKLALTNWAIYTYITSPTMFIDSEEVYIHKPYYYSYNDPKGSDDWTNTQVVSLNNTHKGNCFALASLFKILADRLHTDAKLCTALNHIYITHADDKGTKYNIELGSKNNFPGTGEISAITYTTRQVIQNNIAQKELTTKEAVALTLIYLAKGYEHKFNAMNDAFILDCAETALKYDAHNLNALLLKAEYLENRLAAKNKQVDGLQTEPDFKIYQTLITALYDLGYREMPLEMKNTLIRTYNKEKQAIDTTKLLNQLTTRYATASWGLFDERHTYNAIERYSNTMFDAKTRSITAFVQSRALYNQYDFDPVVFALNIDPLAAKYPMMSPYAFVANSPIAHMDVDGKDIVYFNLAGEEMKRIVSDKVFKTFIQIGAINTLNIVMGNVFKEVPMPKIIQSKNGVATTSPIYQKYDYIIAAQTGIFNYEKDNWLLPRNTNGNMIDNTTVEDLDPTLVKATIMQETTIGTAPSRGLNNTQMDIMQANVYYSATNNDWNESKTDFGLRENGGVSGPDESIYAGIRIMFRKGLTSDGHTSTWTDWSTASANYNGGGADNYGNVILMTGSAQDGNSGNYKEPQTPEYTPSSWHCTD